MAFSTQRGRPRSRAISTDSGTPELRLKHALGLTAEPIDLCLNKAYITRDQHWCGLHLRWLYTLRYGAPILTGRYMDRIDRQPTAEETTQWREMREREYHEAVALLKQRKRYEPVMRLCVFNELPACLSPTLIDNARTDRALAERLTRTHQTLSEGLDILITLWRAGNSPPSAHNVTSCDFDKNYHKNRG